ncbi:glycosyltransferase family 39 protein [Nodosilinea sp. LEGE 07088]|uniref:glycosyltransferase family 39 protein n=1 Tax=Nodosilinea sp. LEGE 07088 TaxID=2777968 RepID=UPI00187F0C80|nr:glycosyltransferase family 39 protein [Nodosilinea sp. LEGE 07088]MBE9140409.1 glycosyltransferase family 39 protein [Nodosilinea sp. LEGE 07088]
MTGNFLDSTPPQLLRRVRRVAIALLIVAIGLRFATLDRKVYWHDEVFTSMVITARPRSYMTADLFQNKLVTPADLLAYQQFVPELTLADMLVRQGQEDVQHPPFYYMLLRFWAQLWGTAPAVMRGFSALLSVLIFPAVYWLCLELFESSLSGWVAIALFAVSPVHLVFAQEAREYGFWTVLVLVTSALLLRAVRSPNWQNWALYGLSMALACYTALFSLGVAIGHGAYVMGIEGGIKRGIEGGTNGGNRWFRARLGRRTVAFGVAMGLVALSFTPWLYFIATSQEALGNTTSWTSVSLPLRFTLQLLAFNFSTGFVDFNAAGSDRAIYGLILPLLGLQTYAMVWLVRSAPGRVWWFIVTLVGSTALLLWLPDLLFGGQRFTVARYVLACVVGLQLAVVYLLSTWLVAPQRWQARLAQLVLALLIAIGLLSCGVYSRADTWGNKVLNSNYHQLAELINRSDRPLILADSYDHFPVSLISLSYLLKPATQLLLLPNVGSSFAIQTLPAGVDTVFLFNLPDGFRQRFEAWSEQALTLAFEDYWNQVWQTTAPPSSDLDPTPADPEP